MQKILHQVPCCEGISSLSSGSRLAALVVSLSVFVLALFGDGNTTTSETMVAAAVAISTVVSKENELGI